MDIEAQTDTLRILCPHCDALNRVLSDRADSGPVCGACKQPLFERHPVTLTEAKFKRHLAHCDLPLIVDFWAPWCAPCRFMAPLFERAAVELEPRARLAKVNTDEEQTLAQRLGIRGIPTFAIFRDGKEVARTAGAKDLGEFVAWARSHL